jgi:hypothetical protein
MQNYSYRHVAILTKLYVFEPNSVLMKFKLQFTLLFGLLFFVLFLLFVFLMQIGSFLCWDRVFSDSTQDLKIALLQKPLSCRPLRDVAEKWATFCGRESKILANPWLK